MLLWLALFVPSPCLLWSLYRLGYMLIAKVVISVTAFNMLIALVTELGLNLLVINSEFENKFHRLSSSARNLLPRT